MTVPSPQKGPTRFPVTNPFTDDVVDWAPDCTELEIADALEAAYAFRCTLSGDQRAEILEATARRIEAEEDAYANLITQESGLSLNSSEKEVRRALSCLRMGAVQARDIEARDHTAEFVTHADPQAPRLTVISEPLDLIVAITPFNHPLNAVAHKVVPAIAAGSAMVLKPSEKTPLTAIRFRQALVECGLPEDMLVVVTGTPAGRVVDQLISFPNLDLVTFTGSMEVGRYIPKKLAEVGNELTRYVGELGGNACYVVMDDCDLDQAATIALSAFENSGQRCTAVRKILLHHAVAEDFLERFVGLANQVSFGDPAEPGIDMGTVISADQAALIEGRVNDALAAGARLLRGNTRRDALYAPTIVDHVTADMELAAKETFGPVASILRIGDLSEAVSIVRRGGYRLACSIATRDREKAERLQNAVAVGQFSWNGPPGYRTEEAPFGGFGDSGNGEKEGIILTTRSYHRVRTFYDHNV